MEEGWGPVLLRSSVSSCGAASSALQPNNHGDKKSFKDVCSFKCSVFCSLTLCSYFAMISQMTLKMVIVDW